MINIVSFYWFSQHYMKMWSYIIMYWQIKSRNFSQISQRQPYILGTTLASKAWASQKFVQVGTSLNIFHTRKKLHIGKKPPPPPPHIIFFQGGASIYPCPSCGCLWAKVNMKCTIFSGIIHHIMIPKIHSRMHPIELFLKNFLKRR